MKVAVSEFKAKCTKIIRDISTSKESIEITNRGSVVAILSPPPPLTGPDTKAFLGCLRGTATYVGDIVSPLGEKDWEACR